MDGSRSELYPDTRPGPSGMLPVGDDHEIYWEECGNPDGVPVIFLHGGPGAGCQPVHRRFFDPAFYRVVLFDQRGCGRSRPHGETRANTTDHLIADMEKLRLHLGIERWLVFGGSWGATLALTYGIRHPEYCLGFVLRGVFLARAEDMDWFLEGIGRFFPEHADRFINHLPVGLRDNPLDAYNRLLNDDDARIRGAAAATWAGYENSSSQLVPPYVTEGTASPSSLAIARLEAHYMSQGCFLPETEDPRGYILAHVHRFAHLPAIIVQGRYDMICPPVGAWLLAKAWPNARLDMQPRSGHSALEPEIRAALVGATERFKEQLAQPAGSAIT